MQSNKFAQLSSVLLENFVRIVYGLSVLLIAQANLDASDFSNFSFYLVLSILVYGVCKFSLDQFAVKKIILIPENGITVVTSLIFWRFIGSVGLAAVIALILHKAEQFVGLLSLLVFFQAVRSFDSYEWFLRANSKFLYQSTVRVFSIMFGLCYLLIVYHCSGRFIVADFVVMYACEWVSLSIVYLVLIVVNSWKNTGQKKYYSHSLVKDIFRMAVFSYMSFFVYLLYSKADQIFLKGIETEDVYGEYMIAARVIEASLIFPMSYSLIIYNKLVRLHDKEKRSFERLVSFSSLLLGFVATAVVAILWGMRMQFEALPYLIKDYLSIGIITHLSWLSISLLPLYFLGLRSTYFSVIGKPKHILIGSLVGVIVQCLIGLPLMNVYGSHGAYISLFLTTVAALYFSNYTSSQAREFLFVLKRGFRSGE